MIYDEYPFFWAPTGFRDEADVASWLETLATRGVSVEILGERVYFRSLDDARRAARCAQARQGE